jgi:hypothetical protein
MGEVAVPLSTASKGRDYNGEKWTETEPNDPSFTDAVEIKGIFDGVNGRVEVEEYEEEGVKKTAYHAETDYYCEGAGSTETFDTPEAAFEWVENGLADMDTWRADVALHEEVEEEESE